MKVKFQVPTCYVSHDQLITNSIDYIIIEFFFFFSTSEFGIEAATQIVTTIILPLARKKSFGVGSLLHGGSAIWTFVSASCARSARASV